MKAGRFFDDRDAADAPRAALLNASAARLAFGDRDPIGQTIETGGRDWMVVGVVEDVAHEARGVFGRMVYLLHAQFGDDRNWTLTQVVASSQPVGSFLTMARAEVNRLDPLVVLYRPLTLESMLAGERARERLAAVLMLVLPALHWSWRPGASTVSSPTWSATGPTRWASGWPLALARGRSAVW